MTDGYDPGLSITTALRDVETGRIKRDSRPVVDEGDGVTFYQDRMLRILLSERPLVLRLTGQADLSHRGAIEQALRRTEPGMNDVIVDLSELNFIDVGGVRQLIDHAGVLGIDGRSVRITGASVAVLRIFHVCLWPKPPPNLRVEDVSGRDLVRADPVHLDGGGHGARPPLP